MRVDLNRLQRGARRAALALILCVVSLSIHAQEGSQLRVGIFENPPLVTRGVTGHVEGIAIDVLEDTANREGWQLEYHMGEFPDLLELLQQGKIDLMVSIARTDARTQIYRFNEEPLITNWSAIYRNMDVPIKSLLDLEGKKIAVLGGDTHTEALTELLKNFGIEATLLPQGTFEGALRAADRGDADAALVNRLVGQYVSPKLSRLQPTGIVFNAINVHYAGGSAAAEPWLRAIDRRLWELKSDPGSLYYKTLNRWLGETGARPPVRNWVGWALPTAGLLLLMFALFNTFLRRQVKLRTAELVAQSEELEREIADRKRAEERLNELAYYDELTGLPNRSLFNQRLRQSLEMAKRQSRKLGVLFFDIDDFKKINDTLGHGHGDQLLKAIAGRLSRRLRETDTLARLGGDEFTVILADLARAEDAALVAHDLIESMRAPFHIDGHEIFAAMSVGITLFPDDGDALDDLLRNADAAMYQAKAAGKRSYQFYSRELTQRLNERLVMENRLRYALQHGELVLHYQPQLSLHENRIIAVEALLRWEDPEEGLIGPDKFVPLAEDSGLIEPIGQWILETASRQLAAWDAEGLHIPRVAVNLSSRQFRGGQLARHVGKALERHGLAPDRLDLEITEGVLMADTHENVATLHQLRALGCGIAIDDFGTGYASFDYLRRLPLQYLKIDRSFVADMDASAMTASLVEAMVAMAHALDLEAIAEGVETESQMMRLRECGCDVAQGYYVARPLGAESLVDWLRRQDVPFEASRTAP